MPRLASSPETHGIRCSRTEPLWLCHVLSRSNLHLQRVRLKKIEASEAARFDAVIHPIHEVTKLDIQILGQPFIQSTSKSRRFQTDSHG